jgi:hypothetical protein
MTTLALLVYLAALLLAAVLLYVWGYSHWYWCAASIAAALGIGMIRVPEAWAGPAADLAIGFAFTFLMVWGLGGLIFHPHAHHRHPHPPPAKS